MKKQSQPSAIGLPHLDNPSNGRSGDRPVKINSDSAKSMDSVPRTRLSETLRTYHFKIKKRYGQNFITDRNLLEKIADAAQIGRADDVLEIGPGTGSLTRILAERAGNVVAVEIDQDLLPILEDTLADCDNLHLVAGDVLQLDPDTVMAQALGGLQRYKVVANLPYYITTPILMRFLEEHHPVEQIVVMVQEEVAERFCAAPGGKDYGAVTVALQYYGQVRILFPVKRQMFSPMPNVDSALIEIIPWKEKPFVAEDETAFRQLVRAAFSQRRKTLRNALTPLAHTWNMDRGMLETVLQQCGIDGGARGETLSAEQFVRLSNALRPCQCLPEYP